MATKVRLTIEYDLDIDGDTVVTPEMLQKEALDWIEGNVSVHDVIECEGPEAFKVELI